LVCYQSKLGLPLKYCIILLPMVSGTVCSHYCTTILGLSIYVALNVVHHNLVRSQCPYLCLCNVSSSLSGTQFYPISLCFCLLERIGVIGRYVFFGLCYCCLAGLASFNCMPYHLFSIFRRLFCLFIVSLSCLPIVLFTVMFHLAISYFLA
jgi:hypothetical protein